MLAGDVNAGDVITLPGGEKVRVTAVRLGSGGFQLTVESATPGGSGTEHTVIVTARTRLRRHS